MKGEWLQIDNHGRWVMGSMASITLFFGLLYLKVFIINNPKKNKTPPPASK